METIKSKKGNNKMYMAVYWLSALLKRVCENPQVSWFYVATLKEQMIVACVFSNHYGHNTHIKASVALNSMTGISQLASH